jgi:hypothetical protein
LKCSLSEVFVQTLTTLFHFGIGNGEFPHIKYAFHSNMQSSSLCNHPSPLHPDYRVRSNKFSLPPPCTQAFGGKTNKPEEKPKLAAEVHSFNLINFLSFNPTTHFPHMQILLYFYSAVWLCVLSLSKTVAVLLN